MVVEGSRQETLDPGFVLLGTRQQGVPVIRQEAPVPSRLQVVVGGSQQETLDPGLVLLGTRQQSVPVILRELVLPGGFELVSPSFTLRDKNNSNDIVSRVVY
ncbi:unnamed protein product [Schistosoma margrebowiei]|uniref:Uncharacterized protein n=1 Tax=Schistosoma margrebowiei TaxID=48269 RepID=A0A183MUS5_9TREM|nr:unnamed protein product [Schistosoma margrebowiei]